MSDKKEKAKAAEAYQWPTSHPGHLTDPQKSALDDFKKLCAEKGYFNPGSDSDPASHDDSTLLRYLRARKFVPQDAFTQFKETEDWRQENELDKLYETIDIHEYEQSRRLYPQWTGRRDKRGMPFYVYELAQVDSKELHAAQAEPESTKGNPNNKTPAKMLRLFALYENMCRFVLPLCSSMSDRPHHETPISQSNNIIDISKVSIRQLWSLRNHLADASQLATAHYPETLDRVFIVGAGSFFTTIWEWAKKWFDPITVSKMFILSNSNVLSTLEKYVDKDNIPKKYGGNLEWNFGDMPSLDPAMANGLRWKEDIMQNGHRTIPIGPVAWQYDADGDLLATAKGSENGKSRNLAIARLHPEAGVTQLALSPGRAEKASIFVAAVASTDTATPTTASADTTPGNLTKTSTSASNTTLQSPASGTSTGTYTVPYREHTTDIASPPTDSRQGTSETRYEQQAFTHADGQLAHGTPDIRGDTSGHAVMEPRTVGQAPKHTPLYDETEERPSVVDQAKGLAGQAYSQAAAVPSTILSAVGMGGGNAANEAEMGGAADKDTSAAVDAGTNGSADSRLDGLPDKHVEEFIRAKTMSLPQSEAGK